MVNWLCVVFGIIQTRNNSFLQITCVYLCIYQLNIYLSLTALSFQHFYLQKQTNTNLPTIWFSVRMVIVRPRLAPGCLLHSVNVSALHWASDRSQVRTEVEVVTAVVTKVIVWLHVLSSIVFKGHTLLTITITSTYYSSLKSGQSFNEITCFETLRCNCWYLLCSSGKVLWCKWACFMMVVDLGNCCRGNVPSRGFWSQLFTSLFWFESDKWKAFFTKITRNNE